MLFSNVSQEELGRVAKSIAEHLGEIKIWLFHGELGSGKTALIKEIGKVVGVDDAMSSPSFAIVNEYHSRIYEKIYHFDFYRIKNELEAYDIGIDEYFYDGYPCFVEWPEKIPSLIPAIRGEVTLSIEDETRRTIAVSVHDGKEENRV